MVDLLGTVLLAGAVSLVVATITATLAAGLPARLSFAAAAGLWVGLVIVLTTTVINKQPNTLLFPALFFVPLILAGIVLATSSTARSAVAGIPVNVLIGINAVRVLGFLFLMLAAVGRLGGPFPYAAGIGDMLTGLFAIPALSAAKRSLNDGRVVVWNAFGLLDLVTAVSLGVLSANGSNLQLIHAGAGSSAISTLPWAMIPLVLVPLFIIGHLVLFARMRSEARSGRPTRTLSAAPL